MSSRSPEFEFEAKLNCSSRVLVINPLNTFWSYQLTSEIALRCREFSENVYWINLGAITPRKYEINESDNYSSYIHGNVGRRIAKFLQASGIRTKDELIHVGKRIGSNNFSTISDLKQFTLHDVPLGKMLFSAIASNLKTTNFEVTHVRDRINFFTSYTKKAFKILEKEMGSFNPNMVLTINDRLIGSSLSIALARRKNVRSYVIYWGNTTSYIEDYSSSLYDGIEWENKISNNWELKSSSDSNDKMDKAIQQLRDLSINPTVDSQLYTKHQIKGKTVDSDIDFCVFYAQSEHEHSGHLIVNPKERFISQYEAFDKLQSICRENHIRLYLKFHPRKKWEKERINPQNRVDWQDILIDEQVVIIDEDSEIDTYALMSTAKFNIVWSSTVGMECIARGIAPIVVGFPLWLNRKWKIHAWDEHTLRRLILGPKKLISPDSLLPYFFYLNSFGKHCRYSDRNTIWNNEGMKVELWRYTILGKIRNRIAHILSRFKSP